VHFFKSGELEHRRGAAAAARDGAAGNGGGLRGAAAAARDGAAYEGVHFFKSKLQFR